MLRIFANDHDAALALDDFALFTNWLYGRLHFHCVFPPFLSCTPFPLFKTISYAATGQVVRCKLNRDLISRQDANEIHADLT